MTVTVSRSVADCMTQDVISIGRDAKLTEAVRRMDQNGLSAVSVVDDDGCVCGILSTSDLVALMYDVQCDVSVLPLVSEFVRKTLTDALAKDNEFVEVSSVMTSGVSTIAATANIEDAASEMLSQHVHHLPVVDESKKPVGIISTTDIVRALAEACEKEKAATPKSTPATFTPVRVADVVQDMGRWEDDGGQNVGSTYEWLPINMQKGVSNPTSFASQSGRVWNAIHNQQPRIAQQSYRHVLTTHVTPQTESRKET